MPSYQYRVSTKGLGCSKCIQGFASIQRMSDPALSHCPRCGAGVYRAIQRTAGFIMPYSGPRGTGHDYRDDLARFPGDPDAFVDGPRALSLLKDKRKRDGWELKPIDMVSSRDAPKGSMAEEAFRRAKAKGFIPDGETE